MDNENDLALNYQQLMKDRSNEEVRRSYVNKIINLVDPKVSLQQTQQNSIMEFILNYYGKDDHQIRKNFYNKLNISHESQVKPSVKSQSFTIFDWDDTLFPTSYLVKNGLLHEEDKTLELLKELDQTCLKLLQESNNYGDVYIITNSGEGWVEHSASRFLPNTKNALREVQIISARAQYEKIYPKDQFVWKKNSFLDLKKKYIDSVFTQIITIGDSFYEIQSAEYLQKCFKNCFSKTIKLKEQSTFEELQKQLNLLIKKLNQIYMANKNLTIKLEKQEFIQQEKQIDILILYKLNILLLIIKWMMILMISKNLLKKLMIMIINVFILIIEKINEAFEGILNVFDIQHQFTRKSNTLQKLVLKDQIEIPNIKKQSCQNQKQDLMSIWNKSQNKQNIREILKISDVKNNDKKDQYETQMTDLLRYQQLYFKNLHLMKKDRKYKNPINFQTS